MCRKRIKQIVKAYDNIKINEAVHNVLKWIILFWGRCVNERDGPKVKTPNKNEKGKVVNDTHGIVDVCQKHFSSVDTPIKSDSFDQAHFIFVSHLT